MSIGIGVKHMTTSWIDLTTGRRCVACGKENDDLEDDWCSQCQAARLRANTRIKKNPVLLVPHYTNTFSDADDTDDEQDGW